MGYTKDTIKGVSWITLLRGITRLFTFIRLAILGRLLTPAQFGFFGIATLVLSFLEILTETGINVFLVQQKDSLKEYINSALVVSIARGIFLAFIIFISAPLIVSFFNAREAYLVVALIAVVPFIRGFINPALVLYQKDLQFNKEFRLRTILFFVDVITSILVGVFTRSAISFCMGLIASATLEVILSYYLISIHPRLAFEYKKVMHILQRGWWVTITGIFSFFADNSDNIVVGKILGSGSLGIYQVAYKFSTLPISEITLVINQVIFPVYSKFYVDKQRLWRAFLKVTAVSSLGAVFLGFAIFVFAEPIILLFMGTQWISAVPVIKVLAIYGVIRTIFGSFSALFLGIHKQEYVAKSTFFRVITLGLTVIPFTIKFGMMGAAYAMLVSILVEIPVLLYFTYVIFKTK